MPCRNAQKGHIKMNRKQALTEAINILSTNPDNKEITDKLQEILSELPLSEWTKNSIMDAIETYIQEHNNTVPSSLEFTKSNKLPSNTVIRHLFNVSSLSEFLRKYFPKHKRRVGNSSPYKDENEDYFIKLFKRNYMELKCKLNVKIVSGRLYKENKKVGEPCLETIIRNCNCNSYEELLILCNYKKPSKPITATVNGRFNDDEDLEFIKEIINETLKKCKISI